MSERFNADPSFNRAINERAATAAIRPGAERRIDKQGFWSNEERMKRNAANVVANPERNDSERLGIGTVFDASTIPDPNRIDHFVDPFTDLSDLRPFSK